MGLKNSSGSHRQAQPRSATPPTAELGPLLQTAGRGHQEEGSAGVEAPGSHPVVPLTESGQTVSLGPPPPLRVAKAQASVGWAPLGVPVPSRQVFSKEGSRLDPTRGLHHCPSAWKQPASVRHSQHHQVTLSCWPEEPYCCRGDELSWPPWIRVKEEDGWKVA